MTSLFIRPLIPIQALVLLAASGGLGLPKSAAAQSAKIPAAITGETRVLAVFARFQDDNVSESGCRAGRGWPLSEEGDLLPVYAHTLFADNPWPPFADSSATEYFYRQSGGSLILYADVYPQVVVTQHEAAYYRRSEGRGYGFLASEILNSIDEDVDFSRYDNNPRDGVVDHVFIFIRKDEAGTFTGVADLAGADRVRGKPDEEIVLDGLRVSWASSGSFIYNERPGHIISQSYMVRMVAHEFGHHIWNPRGIFGNHIPAIRGNGTPGNDDEAIGYVLMAGRGGGDDMRGDLLISAPERDAIGWLNPRILSPESDTLETLRLGDLYATGEAVRIDVVQNQRGDRVSFYLANRQRVGWFDRYRIDAPPGCRAYEMGLLRTTGLLVHRADIRNGRLSLDVLPADNTLELSIENATYEGDLFGSAGATQLTPFTTPSTSHGVRTSTWFAIDEIGMTGSPDSSMRFVFVPDFRRRAVVREDSRLEEAHGRVLIEGDLRITNGSTLTFGPGSDTRVSGSIVVEQGSRAVAMPGSRVSEAGQTRFFFYETEL